MAKYSKGSQKSVKSAMHRMKKGKLKSGTGGKVKNPRQAIANYRAALALGGTRPLPQLFSAAGIRFDFSEQTLAPLMDAVGEELAENL